VITVVSLRNDAVRIGVDAPSSIRILRDELIPFPRGASYDQGNPEQQMAS